MSYTGIAEIDMVLLDLYSEQTLLEKDLLQAPKSKALIQRHRRVTVLADRLLQLGQLIQRIEAMVAAENA